MSRWRKKPIVIEAVQFVDNSGGELAGYDFGEEPEWYRVARTIDAEDMGSIAYRDGFLFIRTAEGLMRASYGNYILDKVAEGSA